jgi:glycine hydroxymethyltransferase
VNHKSKIIYQILEVMRKHQAEAGRTINMVPSENSTSGVVKMPMMLDLYHRYFFNVDELPTDWNFRGAQEAAKLETQYCLPLLRQAAQASYVNLRPLSGLHAMAMVLSALGGAASSTILTISPDQGGHYATEKLANRLGFKVQFISGPDPHTIDYDNVSKLVSDHRPTLVYVDQSNCLFPADVERLVCAVRRARQDTLIHVDCSHWLAFVFGGQFKNPLKAGADSFGGSTHKSFPGPQKAVVATNREDLHRRLYAAQYEMISSHHLAATVGLGIALLEFLELGGSAYSKQIIENTRSFGSHLVQHGLVVEGADRGFSAGHQLWVRTTASGVDAFVASDRLFAAGIRVNAFPELPGFKEPILRLGLNEATYHGFKEPQIAELAAIFSAAIFNREPSAGLKSKVATLRAQCMPASSFSCKDPEIAVAVLEMIGDALGIELRYQKQPA